MHALKRHPVTPTPQIARNQLLTEKGKAALTQYNSTRMWVENNNLKSKHS